MWCNTHTQTHTESPIISGKSGRVKWIFELPLSKALNVCMSVKQGRPKKEQNSLAKAVLISQVTEGSLIVLNPKEFSPLWSFLGSFSLWLLFYGTFTVWFGLSTLINSVSNSTVAGSCFQQNKSQLKPHCTPDPIVRPTTLATFSKREKETDYFYFMRAWLILRFHHRWSSTGKS